MCYSGECKYENHYGDCVLITKELPDDAACIKADREIDKYELKKKKKITSDKEG